MSSYNVYRAVWWGMPVHHALFIETGSDGSGEMYHATGSFADGFVYEVKDSARLENSQRFSHKDLLGVLDSSNKEKFVKICEEIPAPGPHRYNRHDPLAQERGCRWWLEEVVAALKKERILRLVEETTSRNAEQSSETLQSPARHAAVSSQTTSRHMGRPASGSVPTPVPGRVTEESQSTSRHAPSLTPSANATNSPPRQVQAERRTHQGKTGMLVHLNGRGVFIADEHWQTTTVQGKRASYCRSQNIYTMT